MICKQRRSQNTIEYFYKRRGKDINKGILTFRKILLSRKKNCGLKNWWEVYFGKSKTGKSRIFSEGKRIQKREVKTKWKIICFTYSKSTYLLKCWFFKMNIFYGEPVHKNMDLRRKFAYRKYMKKKKLITWFCPFTAWKKIWYFNKFW